MIPQAAEVLCELLAKVVGRSVLDVGCGTGRHLGKLVSPGKTIGLDRSLGMLAHARRAQATSSLVHADATALPFAYQTFDAALCFQVLHHVADRAGLIAEVLRTLRPGGTLLLESWSHEQLRTFALAHYFPRVLEIDRKRIPDTDLIIDLLEAAGFNRITTRTGLIAATDMRNPAEYLEKRVRDRATALQSLTDEEVAAGCRCIRRDLDTGRIEAVTRELLGRAMEIGGNTTYLRAVRP